MDFKRLLHDVFGIKKNESVLFLYDVPVINDNDEWLMRRGMAQQWHREIKELGYTAKIASYEATGKNNANLPPIVIIDNRQLSIDEILKKADIVIALTEYSATAPLHLFAKRYGIRAASMPGFNKKMIPSLKIDYNDVASKVRKIHDHFARAKLMEILFEAKGKEYRLVLDLRFRKPKKDDGDCNTKGTVINLPSGEAFIVPYEGEKAEQSMTKGFLPIETQDGLAIYEVASNKIVSSDKDTALMRKISKDPAVGNIAEAAFGVLGSFGLRSTGKILMDEKLGMHIALGRSEHLGGITSPSSFKSERNIWHQDFVYIEDMQPSISVKRAVLKNNKDSVTIIEEGNYIIF